MSCNVGGISTAGYNRFFREFKTKFPSVNFVETTTTSTSENPDEKPAKSFNIYIFPQDIRTILDSGKTLDSSSILPTLQPTVTTATTQSPSPYLPAGVGAYANPLAAPKTVGPNPSKEKANRVAQILKDDKDIRLTVGETSLSEGFHTNTRVSRQVRDLKRVVPEFFKDRQSISDDDHLLLIELESLPKESKEKADSIPTPPEYIRIKQALEDKFSIKLAETDYTLPNNKQDPPTYSNVYNMYISPDDFTAILSYTAAEKAKEILLANEHINMEKLFEDAAKQKIAGKITIQRAEGVIQSNAWDEPAKVKLEELDPKSNLLCIEFKSFDRPPDGEQPWQLSELKRRFAQEGFYHAMRNSLKTGPTAGKDENGKDCYLFRLYILPQGIQAILDADAKNQPRATAPKV
jgi:hypothetical protein